MCCVAVFDAQYYLVFNVRWLSINRSVCERATNEKKIKEMKFHARNTNAKRKTKKIRNIQATTKYDDVALSDLSVTYVIE